MGILTPAEAFAARAAAYDLLARFFRQGLTADLANELRQLPGVGDAVPDNVDPDGQAAEHYRVFGLDVFPYASAYLEADGRMGGETSDFMARILVAAGNDVAGPEAPDHISTELNVLSQMCRAYAEPNETGVVLHGDLLAHLLSWLPAFRTSVHRCENDLYGRLADLTIDVACDHWRSLPAGARNIGGLALPPPPNLLSDERTSLRDLAEHLSRPALSGIVLNRNDIMTAARSLGLPRGFGDRSLMLGNLLGAAGTYDTVDRLIEILEELSHAWKDYFDDLRASDVEPVANAALLWGDRVRTTLELLSEIRRLTSAAE